MGESSIKPIQINPALFNMKKNNTIKNKSLKIRNIQDVVVLYRMHENNLSKLTETTPNYINMLKQEQQKLKEAYDDID